MYARVFSFCLILISTCLLTNAQQPAQTVPPPPDIYETSVREPVRTNATWKVVESRNFRLGPMTSDGKRLWAVRKFTNTVYVFDSVRRTWTSVGHANWVVGLAYAKGKLWAATQKNILWARDPVLEDVSWKQAGKAEEVVAMTSDGERLWYATLTAAYG